MFDIIVIGAGPAGLTSALYALRANKKVLVLEGKSYGGQIINAYLVENYPGIQSISGFDFATNLYNQVKDLGAEIKFEKVMQITLDKEVKTNKDSYKAKAIIIATGANNRHLGLDREEELTGKGISYCATCDGNFFKNKSVVVVGGGNTALEDALYLSDIASSVIIIHRNDNFRGENKYLTDLHNKDNVHFITNANIVKLVGEDRLNGVILDNNEQIDIDGLFIAIGQEAQNDIFKNIINLNNNGYIDSEDLKTNVPGIFVAGDARNKNLRQLTTAVADGSIAATEAIKYLNEQ